MNDLQNNYEYILESNNPDKHIEYFWYGFKMSIQNLLKKYNLTGQLPVEAWSKKLNDLQKKKQYLEIEEEIRYYMERYGWYVIMYGCSYSAQIFATNIKRWNKISDHYHYHWNYEKEVSMFNVYFKIYLSLIKKEKYFKRKPHLYQMLLTVRRYSYNNDPSDLNEDSINCDNLFTLLDQALEYGEEKIIDYIGEVCDIWNYINDTYDLNIFPKTIGRKILQKYRAKDAKVV